MMTSATRVRKIVHIDEDKCNGCGECVPSCAEGAIQVIHGKARLLADNLCDGLGACLGTCPQDAILIEERPAEAFDEQAVEAHKQQEAEKAPLPCGCPGTMARILETPGEAPAAAPAGGTRPSRLGNFPVQLTLVPPTGPMWQGADVLIAADCVAFAAPDFHEGLLAGKTLAVACPKLDDTGPYVEKLTGIFANNDIQSITVARMDVPCCMGLVHVVQTALAASGKEIPFHDVVVNVDGTTN